MSPISALPRLLLIGLLVSLLGTAASATVPEALLDGMQWRLLGPHRAGWASAVVGAPDAAHTFYFGAAGGGVWKTTDAGVTWTPIFDRGPAAIGAIAVAAADPRVLYVGTGQVTSRFDIAAGQGVYVSRDAGASWAAAGLKDTRHIGAIAIDPRDANTVLVAALGHAFGPNAERGVFRSEDGGKSWTRTLLVSENTGAVDLAVDPADPERVFASVWQMRYRPWLSYFTPDTGPDAGVYQSSDGGRHWQRLRGGGWPVEALDRIGLAATHVNGTTRLYASVDAASAGGLYRSDDAGGHWQRVNDGAELHSSYFARLTVAPDDPDVVYVMGRSIHRCTEAGARCAIIKGSPGGDDYHDLWIDPHNPQRMITGADQGAVLSLNGGQSWSSWYNQPTGQFYHLAADDRFPYWVYAGQQDNGTVAIASRSDYGSIRFRDWHPVGADERDYDIPDPEDPNIVYGSGLGGRLSRFDQRNGEVQNITPWPVSTYGQRLDTVKYRYSWITPIAVSRVPPYPLYQGAQVLFRSNDRGANWQVISPDLSAARPGAKNCAGNLAPAAARDCGYGVIFSIGLSPTNNDELWIGTDDGLVQLSRDGGAHWTDITPAGLPAWGRVVSVDVSALDPASAYLAIDNHRQDDFSPRAFVTHDYGAHWRAIGAGLPAGEFLSSLRSDPVKAGLLYAGTSRDVQVSFDDGASWQSLALNLPSLISTDLLVHGTDLIVSSQGRAIWVLDDLSRLRQITPATASTGPHLFAPAATIRVRRNQNRDTPLPPEEPVGRNPPAGAIIDYWLDRDVDGELSIEIRDDQDRLVRRYASSDQPLQLPAERYFADNWVRPAAAPSTRAGAHRLVWDLHQRRPLAAQYNYTLATVAGADTPLLPEGLLAAPGDYSVVLNVAGETRRAPLKLLPDPRLPLDAGALAASAELSGQIVAGLGRHYLALGQVRALRSQIDAAMGAGAAGSPRALRKALATLAAGLAPIEHHEIADAPGLDSIGEVLSGIEVDLEASDRAPNAPQRAAAAAYLGYLDQRIEAWQQLQAGALARANAELQRAGLPPLTIPAAADIHIRAASVSRELP